MAIINVTGRKPRKSGSDGHGMNTAGKRSPELPNGGRSETGTFMHENEFNRAVERYYAEELRRCGFDYLSLAPGDDDVSLVERDKRTDAFKADHHTDIHANAYDADFDPDGGTGIEVFYYGNGTTKSKQCAEVIHRHLMAELGDIMKSRGVKDGSHLYMLKATNATANLVELGFMDNLHDIQFLLSDTYRRRCARALAKADCEIFGKAYIPVQAPVAQPAPTVVIPNDAYLHVVVAGESLSKIAKKYGLTVDYLAKLNKIANPSLIFVGQRIMLKGSVPVEPAQAPAKPAPVVKKGDQNTNSLVDYLKSIGVDSSFNNRTKLAKQYGISGYQGSPSQNTQLLKKLRG